MKRLLGMLFLMALASLAADKVLTIGLGAHVDISDPPEMVERFFASLEGKGIDAVWSSGEPIPWRLGGWKDPATIEFANRANGIARKHGMKVLLAVNPGGLLNLEDNGTKVKGWWLDPKTGRRVEEENGWDYASPEAMKEFMARLKWYINATKPYEGYIIDEVILISPGEEAWYKRMSQYWSSPTYSDAALVSFRNFVRERKLMPKPEDVKFPVTTQEREPSSQLNMGLPAVPLDEENSKYLIEDNDYAESPLWKAWLAWRVELLTQFHIMQYQLAEKMLSDTPGWVGCFSSAPNFWYCMETGLDKNRIAAIPELKWLVAGYRTGLNLQTLKDAATQNGKNLGGMIELSFYGVREPQDGKLADFKTQVERGAKCMFFYPLSNLNSERNEEFFINDGRGWQPSALKNWMECVKWLRETGRAMK